MIEEKNDLLSKYEDLIISVIRKYPVESYSDKDDAFQAGCVGLCEAYNRFDHKKGSEFSTYAYHWIKKYIAEFSRKNSFHVHIPENQLINSRNIYKEFSGLISEGLSRSDSIKSISSKLEINISEVQNALFLYHADQSHSTYIDDPENAFSIKSSASVFESVALESQIQKLKKRSRKFTKQEKILLDVLYFGKNIVCDSVSDAANKMGISKQSAHELHGKAINKFRLVSSFKIDQIEHCYS